MKKVRDAGLAAPAVFIMGDIVKLRGKVLELPGKR
jgi:hypothetical protein